ncbi:MAG TPA: imidazolonepropionase [Gemmatimonadales bacterium]|nr:imidazolonepropionase [Gemmatimonadales bacterium]
MPLLTNISHLYTCAGDTQGDVGHIADAALAWEGATVRWAGPAAELPAEYSGWEREDAGGAIVVPGLVDCHTHLAFGGWRAADFERRIRGESYLQIAQAGGGISSTVARTRELTEDQLADRAAGFLEDVTPLGVTTVEAKSGYGLTVEDELKTLRAYRALAQRQAVRVVPTFLGAHTVPPEYKDRRGEYVRLVIERMLPAVAREGLAVFCDAFVEQSAFTHEEARAIFSAAKGVGLVPKLHADQLTANGGAELAAEVGAASADHLEHVGQAGIAAMARAGVVAVSLPLATLYLNARPLPARALLDAGVPVAVATDFNPGSAPSWHLPLAMMLACTLQRMTPAEVLVGATRVAARALRLDDRIGSLRPGYQADFALLEADDLTQWLYHFRPNACVRTVVAGRTVWSAVG